MNKDQMEMLKSRGSDFVALVRTIVPDGCDFNLSIRDSGIQMSVTRWDAPNADGTYTGVKRREYLEISMNDNEWGKDWSESTNEYYEKVGILL